MMHFKKFGKYTIIKKIASGGMADILLSANLSPTGFGRFVVIKRALSKFSDNEEFKDMFKNEGKVACNLKHRNITPIYEFGIEKNQFFLSMEYISGRNLRELTRKSQFHNKSIDIPHAVHIIKEVASGLNYAHNAIDSNTGQPLNLIHRDISPQNIMLSFDGEIKLIDFGIAKISDTNLTRAGHLKGKFSYMSPEQALGETLDERTDIFSLGIILWELLTGKRLFASKNEMNALKKVKNCDIPDAQKLNPKIPTELNNIVKKALHKNRNLRYKTASKLEQDLNLFLNKTYPEYSHYDFISLMKIIYRKEIMEERERFKKYSSELKTYLNTINLEETIKTNFELNLPDLISFEGSKSATNQKVAGNQKPESKTEKALNTKTKENVILQDNDSLSGYVSYFSTQTKQKDSVSKRPTQTVENQTTLVKKTYENEEENSITVKKEQNLLEQAQNLNLEKTALNKKPKSSLTLEQPTALKDDLFRNTGQTTMSSSSLRRNATLYNKDDLLEELHSSQHLKPVRKTIRSIGLFFTLIIVLAGFSGAVFWLFKNDDGLILKSFLMQDKGFEDGSGSKEELPERTLSNKTVQTAVKRTESKPVQKKVFINSKPSGAAIYVNKKFSTHTPALLKLQTDQKLTISLKKDGYISKSFVFKPGELTLNSLSILLDADQSRAPSSKKIHIIK